MKGWVEDFGLFLSRFGARGARTRRNWPHAPGKYFVLNSAAPIAVSTLASIPLVEALKKRRPKGLCIVGRTVTENVGIEKVIRNVVSNPSIHTLVLAGKEAPKHLSGQTFKALHENGIDRNMRVIGTTARRPILRNASVEEVVAFRERIQLVDMIGCELLDELTAKIEALSRCGSDRTRQAVVAREAHRIRASADWNIVLDKAGYFVIAVEGRTIVVEHFANDNTLLRTLEGTEARSLYLTIVNGGWVTDLGHAAYLGKELTRAELAIRTKCEYVQDRA